MEDVVKPVLLEQPLDEGRIGHASLHERTAHRDIVGEAAAQVVNHDYIVSVGGKVLRDVGPDEARTSGHKSLHRHQAPDLGVGSTVNSPLRRPRTFDQQREVITIATGADSEPIDDSSLMSPASQTP